MILCDIMPSLWSALFWPIEALTTLPCIVYAQELLPRFLATLGILQTTVVTASEVGNVVNAHGRSCARGY